MHFPRLLSGRPSPSPATGVDGDGGSVRAFLRAHRRLLLVVFGSYLLVHLFIFRGILAALPDILAGRSVLSASELVPFFNIRAQFIDQVLGTISSLTQASEFRVRYSLLTTWMRHYQVLPFAIVLAPLIFSFLSSVVVGFFLTRLSPRVPAALLVRASAFGTLLLHLILLQAEVTHFYTLVLGFHLFTIACTFLLYGIFLSRHSPVRSIVFGCILLLINPAVHYLLLGGVVLVFVCLSGFFLCHAERCEDLSLDDASSTSSLTARQRMVLALLCFAVITVVPYALFVHFFVLRGIPNLADIAPGTYQSIQDASVSLMRQLALDLRSATENFIGGNAGAAHVSKLLYILIAFLPFTVISRRLLGLSMRSSRLLLILALLFLLSLWCSLGYPRQGGAPTFHVVLAALYNLLYGIPGPLASICGRVISTVINVLREPDRFQLIGFLALSFVLPLGVAVVELWLRSLALRLPRLGSSRVVRTIVSASFVFLLFLPLIASWDSRSALLSGDFGGFLAPYPLAPIQEIKQSLLAHGSGITVVWPPSEVPRFVRDSFGVDHKFTDKFLLYYLDQPSYYYGLSGDLQSKQAFFTMMAALERGEHWWVNGLRDLRIRYLVINKELRPENGDLSSYARIERAMRSQPDAMPESFRLLHENASYALFEFLDPQRDSATETFLDVPWETYACMLQHDLTFTRQHVQPLVRDHLDPSAPIAIVTTDVGKSLLDYAARVHPTSFSRPDQTSFIFNPDHIPSSAFFGTIFSMFALSEPGEANPTHMILRGPYDTLTGTFVALPRPTTIRFPLTLPDAGSYEIYLRAAATRNTLSWRLDSGTAMSKSITALDAPVTYIDTGSAIFGPLQPVDVSRRTDAELSSMIPSSVMPVVDRFHYIRLGSVQASRGQHWLTMTKMDSSPLVVEGIMVLSQAEREEALHAPAQVHINPLTPASL